MEILSFAEIMIFWSEILLGKKTNSNTLRRDIRHHHHDFALQYFAAKKVLTKSAKKSNKIVSSLDGNLCNQRKNGCKI